MKRGIVYFGTFLIVLGFIALAFITKKPIFIYLLFGLFFLLSILMLPLYFVKFRKEYQRQEKLGQEETIKDINTQKGDNQLSYNASQVKAVVDTWKHASKMDIWKGTIFLIFFLGCIIGFLVCMICGLIVWGIVCFALGFSSILLALVVVKLLERRSLKLKAGRSYQKGTAVVIGSVMSSQGAFKTGRHQHIGNTIYKVYLDVQDRKIISYSKEYYKAGDKVRIQIDKKNPKIVQIIGKQTDIFGLEENEF